MQDYTLASASSITPFTDDSQNIYKMIHQTNMNIARFITNLIYEEFKLAFDLNSGIYGKLGKYLQCNSRQFEAGYYVLEMTPWHRESQGYMILFSNRDTLLLQLSHTNASKWFDKLYKKHREKFNKN